MTPEMRSEVLKRAWEVAQSAVDNADLKSFSSLCKLLENAYQFDVRLAERVQKEESKALVVTATTQQTGSIEDQRQRLIERIEALGGSGADT